MKFNWTMPDSLVKHYDLEMQAYRSARKAKDFEAVWFHLERAHIIGQRYPFPHCETHWEMLIVGILEKRPGEVLGQIIRLLLSAPFSFINRVPIGNPGSVRISMLKSQELPTDIARLFKRF